MKICAIEDGLCLNVAHIVSYYILDECINVSTSSGDEYALVVLEAFDPLDKDDARLRDRIYDEILQGLMDPKIQYVDPDDIAARVIEEMEGEDDNTN